MVDVTTEIIIDCPRKMVSEYAANPQNAPEWYVNIKSSEWVQSENLEIGSQIAFNAKFLGRQLVYTYQIVEYSPTEKLVMRTSSGPFPMETTYTWRSAGECRTHMALRNKGNPTGFSIFFSPILALAMRKANKKDLERLKWILENRNG